MPEATTDWCYSKEDLQKFEAVCDNIGLPAIKKVLGLFEHSATHLREYLRVVSAGKESYQGTRGHWYHTVHITSTQSAKKYHDKLHTILFEIPFVELPFYLDEEPEFEPMIKWRLEIGK